MTAPKYDWDLITTVADAIATADSQKEVEYENLAIAALDAHFAWSRKLHKSFLDNVNNNDQEDDGA
jgi:hypothetical protein